MSWSETGFLAGKIDSKFNKHDYNDVYLNQSELSASTLTTLYTVSGSGYVDLVSLKSSGACRLLIQVDGVDVYDVNQIGASGCSLGIHSSDFWGASSLIANSSAFPIPTSKLPYTNSSYNGSYLSAVFPSSLKFKTSLTIRYLTNSATASFVLLGGVK